MILPELYWSNKEGKKERKEFSIYSEYDDEFSMLQVVILYSQVQSKEIKDYVDKQLREYPDWKFFNLTFTDSFNHNKCFGTIETSKQELKCNIEEVTITIDIKMNFEEKLIDHINELFGYFEKLNITELILSEFSTSLLHKTLGKKFEKLSSNFEFLRIQNVKEDESISFKSWNKTSLVRLMYKIANFYKY